MIEIKNVTKKYGNTIAVDNISFNVKDGEVVGFLGPNGAGKSTTMNMITGFIEPTNGQIIINGNDISKKPRKAKKDIGYMPENVPLYYELTAKEFVTYMAELKMVKRNVRKEEVEKVIKDVGLEEVQNKLIRNLSRGYKQRVSMAGALIGNPDVIILDEPTVGLDPKQITEIRNLIKELGRKHTVILSSHILSEVSQICERVIIINKGKVIAIDTPENLEKATKDKNSISIIVEDPKDNVKNLKEKFEAGSFDAIVTNPPYKHSLEFVEHALECVREGRFVCMFLKIQFLEGQKRKHFFLENPPVRVWVSSSRIKCAINGDFDANGQSAACYAWYVWQKGYKGKTELKWFN